MPPRCSPDLTTQDLTKYMPGDEVRCIAVSGHYFYSNITVGRVYVVAEGKTHSDWVRLEEDDRGARESYLLEDFELASVQEIEDNIDWSFTDV